MKIGVCFTKMGVCFMKTGVCFTKMGVCFMKTGVCFMKMGVCFTKMGVCFMKTGVCFTKMVVCLWKWKFVLWKWELVLRKWEFVFSKIGVCFTKMGGIQLLLKVFYTSMLDYDPVSLLKTINVCYSIWFMWASVCGSSIADNSCLILFLYTSSVNLIVIWTTGQISAWQNQAMISSRTTLA